MNQKITSNGINQAKGIDMMKVLLISETMIDGVGKHVIDLIKHLDKKQLEIHVIHSKKRCDDRFRKIIQAYSNQVTFYEVASLTRTIGSKDVTSFRHIMKLVRTIKPDIVHCHSSKAGVIGRICAKVCGVKQIYYTPHAYASQNAELSKKKRVLYLFIERMLGRMFTSKTIHVSKGEEAFALEHKIMKKNNSLVIYNGISKEATINQNENTLRKKYDLSDDQLIIGYVARLYHQKNPQEFINIAKVLVKQSSEVVFVLVGIGEFEAEIVELIREEELEDNVILTGFQEHIADYYELFDIYLSTALYEGLPYTLIEAMRAGLPAVVSDVTGNNELIINKVNGFLYPVGDIDAAVMALECLIEDHALRANQSCSAIKLFSQEFTLDEMIKKHEVLYLRTT